MNIYKSQQISISFYKYLPISLIFLFLGTILFFSQKNFSIIPQPTTKAQSSYPQCQQGRITSPCQCGNQIYSAGFCCYHPNANSGIWFDPSYEDILPNGCPTGNFYFVDQNNPNASDENPGTEELPWKTIIHGCAQVKAGDILLVKNGVYATRSWADGEFGPWTPGWMVPGIVVNNSGTVDNPIIVKAYPGHKPIIDGQTADHSTFGTYKASYVIIDGFKVVHGLIFINNSEHITIQNCELIYGWTKSGDPSYTNMIEFRYTNFSTVRNCIIYGNKFVSADGGTNRAAIILHWADDILIENNLFYDNVIAYRNKCGNNGQQGHRNIFRKNIVKNCDTGVHMGGYEGASTDNKIIQNIFVNIKGSGIYENGGNIRLIIANNVFYADPNYNSKSGVGIFSPELLDESPDNEIYNNIFVNIKSPISNHSSETDWPPGLYCDYNLYSNFVGFDQYWTYLTFDGFKSRVGENGHCIIDQDSLFVNAEAHNFHLSPNSPCLNAGIDRQDYDNDGNTTESINMGAYITDNETIGLIDLSQYIVEESQPNSCASQNGVCCNENQICQNGTFISSSDCGNLCCTGECVSPSIPGDLNQDNKVNSSDFQILIQKFKETQNIETEDLNSDGIVDIKDIGILMHYWTN